MKNIILFIAALLLFSCESMPYEALMLSDMQETILEDYFITAISFADDGSAWIGTFEQGLLHYDDGELKVYDSGNSEFPASSWVSDIEIDADGNVWIAAGQLYKYDGRKFTNYSTDATDKAESNINDIAIDLSGQIWTASSNSEEAGVNNISVAWDNISTEKSDIPSTYANAIAVDSKNNIWVAFMEYVNNAQLAKISKDTIQLFGETELGFSPYTIRDIAIDSYDRIWGVIDYSLSSTLSNERPTLFSFDGTSSETYQSENEYFSASIVSVDSDDNIWVANFKGINVLHDGEWIANIPCPAEHTLLTFANPENSELWMGTDKGICIYNVMLNK